VVAINNKNGLEGKRIRWIGLIGDLMILVVMDFLGNHDLKKVIVAAETYQTYTRRLPLSILRIVLEICPIDPADHLKLLCR
jgi:hypothetical protein